MILKTNHIEKLNNKERKNYTYNLNKTLLNYDFGDLSPIDPKSKVNKKIIAKKIANKKIYYTPKNKLKFIPQNYDLSNKLNYYPQKFDLKDSFKTVKALSNKFDSVEVNSFEYYDISKINKLIKEKLNPLIIFSYINQKLLITIYSPVKIVSNLKLEKLNSHDFINILVTYFIQNNKLTANDSLYEFLYRKYLTKNIQVTKDKQNDNVLKNKNKVEKSKTEIDNTWSLYIPRFDDLIQIKEGTNMNILNNGSGHFIESAKENGNVCLAGHNRGFKVNAFKNLRNLNVGSKLIYKYMKNVYTYKVTKKEIIDETDFTNIDRTGDYLTLITCVKNTPTKRLSITAEKVR